MQNAMKKNLVMAAIVALTGVGSYLGYRSITRTNAGESDLLLANAEALARDEIVDQVACFGSGKRNVDRRYTDCTTCTAVEGWEGQGKQTFCSIIR